ncbi:hypothetical protein [Pseudomonas sp. CBC3]|uniref:hypothetical protein n=1 Tax=Pseudomonas sp. CBC3 TaxID=3123318 RepID=UPI0030E79DA2
MFDNKLKKIKLHAIVVITFSFVFLRAVIPAGIADLSFLVMLCFFIPKIKFSKHNLVLPMVIILFLFSVLVSAIAHADSINIMDLIRISVYSFVAISIVGLSQAINQEKEIFIYMMRIFLIVVAVYSVIVVVAFILFYMNISVLGLHDLLYIRRSIARASGLADNPNYYSFSMFFAFVIAFFAYKLQRISKIVLAIIFLGGLISLSRGFILSVIIFTFVYASLSFSSPTMKFKGKYTVNLIFTFFVSFLIYLSSQYDWVISETLQKIFLRFSDGGGGAGARLESVTNWYQFGTNYHWQLLLGNGSDFFRELSSTNNAAHNTYIRILGEFGLPSLIAFLLSLVVSGRLSIRKLDMFSSSVILSLAVLIFTNDYYLVRETWLIMAFLYIAPSLQVNDKSGVNLNG